MMDRSALIYSMIVSISTVVLHYSITYSSVVLSYLVRSDSKARAVIATKAT